MYKEKLTLTNPSRIPFALSNNFDDTFGLVDRTVDCMTAEEFCMIANRYHNYGPVWKIDKDSITETRLIYTDKLGNIRYLIAYKDVNKDEISDITDDKLVMELIRRGYKVSRND